MRRSRTPATAWPAVADLMTILAVIGLSAAAALTPQMEELKHKVSRIAVLEGEIRSKESRIVALKAKVKALRENALDNDPDVIGFKPCWLGSSGEKRYFTTYDVTFTNGRYSVSRHRDFAKGTTVNDGLPDGVVAVLEGIPEGPVNEAILSRFGRRVVSAMRSFDGYPRDCRLAVTINREATGHVIDVINQAGFFPVYR